MKKENILEFFHTGYVSNVELHQFMLEHLKKCYNHRVVHQTVSAHYDLSSASMISDRLTLSPFPTISIANGTHNLGSTLVQSSCALRLAYKYASFCLGGEIYPTRNNAYNGYMGAGRENGFARNVGYVPPDSMVVNNPLFPPELLDDIMKVLHENIGITAKEFERKVGQQSYYTVFDALNLGSRGIIDGIITQQQGPYRYEILMRNDVTKVVDLQESDFSEILNLTAAAVRNPAIAEVNKK